jgi:uncharacterized protein YbjQ (UPF0145 family)
MLMTTTDEVPGKTTTHVLGLVRGNTIRARNVGADVVAGLRNIVGGELPEYTSLMSQARDEAIQRMADQATALGADAIVAIRMTTSAVTQGAAEIVAYGTAVKLN